LVEDQQEIGEVIVVGVVLHLVGSEVGAPALQPCLAHWAVLVMLLAISPERRVYFLCNHKLLPFSEDPLLDQFGYSLDIEKDKCDEKGESKIDGLACGWREQLWVVVREYLINSDGCKCSELMEKE
jgi:DNA polymerase III psi subunit